jgi:pyruvate,orthophosphate dikinase
MFPRGRLRHGGHGRRSGRNLEQNDAKQVIMVRPETKPDDVHGMLAAQGILTSRGGRTSHAALVARQFGKPAVVGVSNLNIDMAKRQIEVGDKVIGKATGSPSTAIPERFIRAADTIVPDIKDPWLIKLLSVGG